MQYLAMDTSARKDSMCSDRLLRYILMGVLFVLVIFLLQKLSSFGEQVDDGDGLVKLNGEDEFEKDLENDLDDYKNHIDQYDDYEIERGGEKNREGPVLTNEKPPNPSKDLESPEKDGDNDDDVLESSEEDVEDKKEDKTVNVGPTYEISKDENGKAKDVKADYSEDSGTEETPKDAPVEDEKKIQDDLDKIEQDEKALEGDDEDDTDRSNPDRFKYDIVKEDTNGDQTRGRSKLLDAIMGKDKYKKYNQDYKEIIPVHEDTDSEETEKTLVDIAKAEVDESDRYKPDEKKPVEVEEPNEEKQPNQEEGSGDENSEKEQEEGSDDENSEEEQENVNQKNRGEVYQDKEGDIRRENREPENQEEADRADTVQGTPENSNQGYAYNVKGDTGKLNPAEDESDDDEASKPAEPEDDVVQPKNDEPKSEEDDDDDDDTENPEPVKKSPEFEESEVAKEENYKGDTEDTEDKEVPKEYDVNDDEDPKSDEDGIGAPQHAWF